MSMDGQHVLQHVGTSILTMGIFSPFQFVQ